MHVITKDNYSKKVIEDPGTLEDLRHLAGLRLDQLRSDTGGDLWLFPKKGDRYDDKIEGENLFTIEENRLVTGNIMGFVGYGDTEITIRSRFSNDDGNDWFMQYLLQRVFAINVFDLKHSKSEGGGLDMAALMLPYFLQKALHQGLYREYSRQDYNDSHPKGRIDIIRHIRVNYPFKNGKMAYSTREFTYDNSITQLVRHTIEYIKSKKEIAAVVLYSSAETQSNIKQIIEATPSYKRGDLSKVMLANIKPKIHPYYSEYRPLQRLCMQILRGEKVSYGEDSGRIHGILFDGAWLWEEYLNFTFHDAGFVHPENKTGKGKIFAFKGRSDYYRFPDFLKDNIIADAKYKVLLRKNKGMIEDNLSREDLHQMISYMHITASRKGIFVSPLSFRVLNSDTGEYYPETAYSTRVGELYGDGGNIYIIGMNIPQSCESFKAFSECMTINEKELYRQIQRICESEELRPRETMA